MHNIENKCKKFKNEFTFFHFLCNRLIIRDAFFCFLYLHIPITAMHHLSRYILVPLWGAAV